MTADHVADGLRLCRASGWNQLAEDWRVFIDSPASAALTIEAGGISLGTAAYIRYDALAWIAMMLVDPAARGKGLGGKLLAAVLSSLDGFPCVGLDATPAGERLYRRFGFVASCGLVRTKAAIRRAGPPDPSGNVRRILPGDLPPVWSRDREVFGADRSPLLSSMYARAPECAWLACDGAGITGYTFGRPGYLYHQLGPIVAADAPTARDLAASALLGLRGREVVIDVPEAQQEWLAFLKDEGFAVERRFTRMLLRGHVLPGVPERQYGICGPEFG
jgi:GNAT superfamily N-acetyltransferase